MSYNKTEHAAPEITQKKCALVLIFLAGLVYFTRQCFVVIDCLLTVVQACRVAAAADALLVYIPHPATPHMDLGAAWTPHIDLAVMLLLRCSLEARSNSMGAQGMHSMGLYQQNCNGVRAICFAWLMLADYLVFFVVNSCLFALPCRGVFALPCWAQNLDRAINEPANRLPESFSPPS